MVSAKIEIIQGRNIGSKTIKNIDFTLEKSTKENEFASKHKEIIIKIILTSYEIIWANLRILPKSAYLELDVHPAIITKYTLIPETQMNINTLNLKNAGWLKNGKSLHRIKLKNRLPIGARKKVVILLLLKRITSLVNSFIASAKGWRNPIKLTLFGPLRNWLYPKTLRSNKVKKAIANMAVT